MIRFEGVTFTYPDAAAPALRNVDLSIDEGQLCLVVGPTGSGKSTLLGAINGLVPRFTGGVLSGTVTVDGRPTHSHRLKDLAEVVGMVAQDPSTGFTAETVEDELAYTMEQLGVDPQVMRKRVEETLDLLGLADLRHRRPAEISGGEAQRVAIGSVLTAHPRVLVLDEPTSALDPTAAEEVLATITRLVHDLGITVVMAEHRLERVIQYADLVVHLSTGGVVTSGEPVPMMTISPVAPPVVELGRLAGWEPAPLSVRDARRHARDLRRRLGDTPVRPRAAPGRVALSAARLSVVYGEFVAVREVDLELAGGSVTALMGRNGAGKSSLLWALQGSGPRHGGRVDVAGSDPAGLSPPEARRLVGLVPQTPADLLYLESVADECRQADTSAGTEPGTCARLAGRIVGPLDPAAHPADLSEGQKLGLVLAIQLCAGPAVVLLDEPTRGLDYAAKRALGAVLAEVAGRGRRAVVVATHDVEFVASVAHRVVVMAEGEIVADGATAEVVTASPAFAPQVAKILAPDPWLTVAEVEAALDKEAV